MTLGHPPKKGAAMKQKMMAHLRHGWFLWIGGACFLMGSLVAGSVGLASPATTGTTTTGTTTMGPTVNQGAPGNLPWPVTTSGNVGLSGSLPAGSNDIGTVHVAPAKLISGLVRCGVGITGDATSNFCDVATGLSAGTVVNTVSVECDIASGQKVLAEYDQRSGSGAPSAAFLLPLSLRPSSFNSAPTDTYVGTLTNLNIPATSNDSFRGTLDYIPSNGNGGGCTFNYTATTP
jgi:hypothetical protein